MKVNFSMLHFLILSLDLLSRRVSSFRFNSSSNIFMNGSSVDHPNLKFLPRNHVGSRLSIKAEFVAIEKNLSEFVYIKNYNNAKMTENFVETLKYFDVDNLELMSMSNMQPYKSHFKSFIVMMIKDEEDIIYENLCWHYFLGFRNFFVIDNFSTDKTSEKIKDFRRNSKGIIFIFIQEKDVVYKQTSRMNAAYRIIENRFPRCKWIFPIDADEFLMFENDIESTLQSIPVGIDAIYSPRFPYRPHDDYDPYYPLPFYEKIHFLHKRNYFNHSKLRPWNGKTFFKTRAARSRGSATPEKDFILVQGNHFVSQFSPGQPTYNSSLLFGISIREYHFRSLHHTLSKIVNIGISFNKLVEVSPHKRSVYGIERYERYKEQGMIAIKDIFLESYGADEDTYFIDDPLPLKRAVQFFEERAANTTLANKTSTGRLRHSAGTGRDRWLPRQSDPVGQRYSNR